MKPPSPVLATLLSEHRAVEGRIQDMEDSPHEVLAAGQALLTFARQEDEAFAALASLMDRVVLDEMSAEHDEIASDLELLEWLAATTPASLDTIVLSESLARRMKRHVSRDGRLLARAAGMRQA